MTGQSYQKAVSLQGNPDFSTMRGDPDGDRLDPSIGYRSQVGHQQLHELHVRGSSFIPRFEHALQGHVVGEDGDQPMFLLTKPQPFFAP